MASVPTFSTPFKAGSTLAMDYALANSVGSRIASISCQVRFKGELVQTLTVTPLGTDGTNYHWTLSATAAQTVLWNNKALLLSDVKHVFSDGSIQNGGTFAIQMTERQTQ